MNYIAIDKSYIESRIAQLTKTLKQAAKDRTEDGKTLFIKCAAKISLLEILKSEGIEIPIEERWIKVREKSKSRSITNLELDYPNGVIIKPK